MAFVEDTAPFLADFGVDAVLAGQAVRGIFDAAYATAFGGMVDGNGPTFMLPASVAAQRGQTLLIGASAYTVTGVEPDGVGMVLLRLDQS